LASTDPARELAITMELIANSSVITHFDQRIASGAKVNAWSKEFFQILFQIVDRCDFVSSEIRKLKLDEDLRDQAVRSVEEMKSAFIRKDCLSKNTKEIAHKLSEANITILKFLSGQIRENVSYHLLTPEEKNILLDEVGELIEWLTSIQSDEADFIREALIEGLRSFKFRLERLDWFGWGYTVSSLRRVLEAYMALEGGLREGGDGQELIKAVLLKTRAFVQKVVKITEMTKSASETGAWALKVYGAVSAISDGSETISGLLN